MQKIHRKVLISLYDFTTISCIPWAEAGYTCFCVDIQHPRGYTSIGNIIKVGLDIEDFINDWKTINNNTKVSFLSAFPPCTDLAVSGAAHFKSKLLKNPRYRDKAMYLVYLAKGFGDYLHCPYYIENPISVISSEWRKPDYIFNPWEYGGYLPEKDVHPKYPNYIAPRDAYQKRTCLWTNYLFNMPKKLPIHVTKGYSSQYTQLGGKSLKTKNIRSCSPRGFSKAVYLANK